jgi:hypothetical protein
MLTPWCSVRERSRPGRRPLEFQPAQTSSGRLRPGDVPPVETIRLKTLHVLLFIHLSTRRIVAAGVTAHPDTAWVTEQARNAAMDLHDRGVSIRILLRDHDARFTGSFDEVFRSEGGLVRWASEGLSGQPVKDQGPKRPDATKAAMPR